MNRIKKKSDDDEEEEKYSTEQTWRAELNPFLVFADYSQSKTVIF